MPSTRQKRARVSYNISDAFKDLDSEVGITEVASADSSEDAEFNPEEGLMSKKVGDMEENLFNGEEEEESEERDDHYDEEEEEEEEEEVEKADAYSEADSGAESEAVSGDHGEAYEAGEAGEAGSGSDFASQSKEPKKSHTPRITRRPGLPAKSNSKRERIESIYGNDVDALLAGIKARDLWIMDPVIPCRKNLSYTPFYRQEKVEIVDLGNGKQESQWLDYGEDRELLEAYLPHEDTRIKCILGPLGGQKIITFSRFGICDMGTVHKGRLGYIVNAGGHIAAMDWVPNRPTGFQYLAISIKLTIANTQQNLEIPPAYRRVSGPGHIQVWRIPADSDEGTIAGKPSLALVICHEWGNVRSLKWCPIPQGINDPQEIGYLAGIFGDGTMKILRVTIQDVGIDYETSFVKIVTPLFEGRIPETLCTCLTWMSTHEVAVGCANGFAVVWDIRDGAIDNYGGVIPPIHYLMLHQTYILDIESCFPSYPRTIVTSSMDGHCRLTSLNDPQADTILTGRSRLSSNAVVWVDCIHTVLASEDGAWVKMYPLRRFWSSTSVARQSQGGVILDLASSKCHPFVLAAGGEGEVVVFNPLRKTFHGKIKVYQQTWFQLEYSTKSNMYRIMEGFKMEKISFKFETRGSKGDGHSTVFEERGSVTAVCWNGNPEFGGWAAAGSAGGLVRIEDLAYD